MAGATGWRRGRTAGAAFAELVESAADIHGRELAESLGITCSGPLTPEIGAAVTKKLRKDS